jgi:quercetin dioxygenase-like cupin family protein
MAIQVVRFGVGHRRPDGPPGSVGLTGQVIHNDARGVVSELAFSRGGRIEPHSNPNTTWFIVIEGGGWVEVGDEQTRVAAGEAVLWPADIVHGAWTDFSEMRAFVVEYPGRDDGWVRGILEGLAQPAELPSGERRDVERGDGRLAERPPDPNVHDRTEGEPL